MTPEQKAIVRMWAKLRVPTECRYSEYQSKDWSMANVEEFFEADEARLSKHYFRRPR